MAMMRFLHRVPATTLLGIRLYAASCLMLLSGIVVGADCTELLRRGVEARKAGNLRSAIGLFREAIRDQPQNPTAYVKAAEAYNAAYEQWELSYSDMPGQFVWSAPDDWRKHAVPPYRFSILHEPGLPTKPSYDGTVPIEVLHQRELAEQATRLAPDDGSGWRWLGEAYFVLAEQDKAERCFRRAVELMPEDAALRCWVGRLYRDWKRSDEALLHLNEAVRLAPHEREYQLFRCACRCEMGDVAGTTADLKALGTSPEGIALIEHTAARSDSETRGLQIFAFYSSYIRLRPKDAIGYDNRATFLIKAKEYEKALADADSALAIHPDHPTFLYRRWMALHLLERYEEALETIGRACELRPYEPALEMKRALSLNELHRYQELQVSKERVYWLQDWLKHREMIEAKPDDPAAWLEGGHLALKGAEYEAAKTCFARAVELAPKSVVAHHGLAWAYMDLHQPKAALAAIDRAIELGPASPDPYLTRAAARTALGDFDGAIADCEAASQINPKYINRVAEAYVRRAEHRETHDDAAGAAEDRQHAEELRRNPFDVASP